MKRTTVLAVLILLALPNSAWAQTPTPGATNFPLIGITLGQSLRVNLVAISVPASPGSVAFPPNPCVATLGFQDRNGNTLGNTKTVTLAIGQTASLAVNAADVIVGVTTNPTTASADANAAGVAEVLPMVTPSGGNGASCVATVEVVDNLLRTPTQSFTGSVALPANPIFGPQSVYPLLNVQLDVVASPPKRMHRAA
jgi:hypothetical protein